MTDSHKRKLPKIQTSFQQYSVDNLLIAGFLSKTIYYICSEENCINNWDFNSISKEKINSQILSLAEDRIKNLR